MLMMRWVRARSSTNHCLLGGLSRREATQRERCSEATLVDALNDRVKQKKMDKTSESQE